MKIKQYGFTLIELMIVVAIIGILVAVAIPAYSDYIAKSKVSEANMIFAGLKTELITFYADEGHYPQNLDSLPGVLTAGNYTTLQKYEIDSDPPNGGVVITVTVTTTVDVIVDGVKAVIKWIGIQLGIGKKGMVWSCKASDSGTTMPDKYLPKACKD